MASPDNRDLGAAVVWMRRPGYRGYAYALEGLTLAFIPSVNVEWHCLFCQSHNSQAVRRGLHHNASNGQSQWCRRRLEPQGAPMAKWTRDTRCTDCASSPHAMLGQSLIDAISGKADSRQARLRSIPFSSLSRQVSCTAIQIIPF
jgi:hypothetical protein